MYVITYQNFLLGGFMKILLLSHGDFSKGLFESFEMIVGNTDNISYLSLDNEGISKFENKVREKVEDILKEDKLLILSDLKGGTPYNTALRMQLENPEDIGLLSGMNLPMLLEVGMDTSNDLHSVLEIAVNSGKEGITFSEVKSEDDDDDDLF